MEIDRQAMCNYIAQALVHTGECDDMLGIECDSYAIAVKFEQGIIAIPVGKYSSNLKILDNIVYEVRKHERK